MQIELSNGLNHVWQWDKDITVTVPEGVDSVHFRWGNRAVEIPIENQTVTIPPELMQETRKIRMWTYTPEHTMDMADIPVEPKNKPADYVYTPTEIKTWEQLDERIKALEQGGSVAGVSSINGKTGAVELTAEDVGAATPEDVASAVATAAENLQPKGDYITQDGLQSATDAALAQAKASGEFDGPPGAPGTNGTTPHIGDNGNWYLGETDTGKPSRGQAGAGLDVTGATVGQIVKIAAVDDNGVPTAWSAVDMPSGGIGSETWALVAEITTTENVNSIRATFDACSAVVVEFFWGGVENDLGDIGIFPNTGDTPYVTEQRAAAAMVTSSTAKKRGVLCVRMDCRVGSHWYATSWQKDRGDGSFGAIDAGERYNLDIGLNGSAQYSFISSYYMTTRDDTPASGVKSITAYGAGMAIGTTLNVWGIKK